VSVSLGPPRFRLEPYVEFAKVAIAKEATYRFDVFTSIASVLVRVYILRTVWVALYAHNAAPKDLPLHAIVTYSTVAMLMSLVMDIDQTRVLHDSLHDGSIVLDFTKPMHVPLYFIANGTGEVLFHAMLMIPALLFSLLIVHIDVPSIGTIAVFFVSFLLGYGVGFCINFILNCSAFFTLEISAVQLIVTWITDLAGGELVPLVLFPVALQNVLLVLPFAAMFSTPLLIYVGHIPPERYAQALGLQAFWLVILATASTIMWRLGTRRLISQGG
jgi:ABC-2 type transport system permease protein